MSELSQKRKGVYCMIFSAFSFSLMNLCVKLAGNIPAIEKSFFRNLVAVLVAFIMLKRSGGGFHVEKKNLPVLVLRSVLGTIGIFANFYAISHLVLPDATMLNKLSPFCTLLFSFLFLGEELVPLQVISIIVAFVGSAFIIKPSFDLTATMPALIGAVGGICAGGAYTCVRCLGKRGERGPMIVFFFSVFSCLAAVPFIIADFQPITLTQFLILMGAGAGAAGGQFGITAAYKYAPAGEISIYDYSTVFFAAIWGFLAFGEVPDALSILGYGLIFGMSLLMFIYNGKRTAVQK